MGLTAKPVLVFSLPLPGTATGMGGLSQLSYCKKKMKGLLETSYFKTSPAPLLDMNEETRGLVVPGSPEQEDILDKMWAGCVDLFLPLSLSVSLSPFLFHSLSSPCFYACFAQTGYIKVSKKSKRPH